MKDKKGSETGCLVAGLGIGLFVIWLGIGYTQMQRQPGNEYLAGGECLVTIGAVWAGFFAWGLWLDVKDRQKQVETQKQKAAAEEVVRQQQEVERQRQERAMSIADIDKLDGLEFEHYVARLLERKGFQVTVTRGSSDLGVDVIAQAGDVKWAIQVKRYTGGVSRHAISDVVAGKHYYGCNAAAVVTNSFFTQGAIDLARSTDCKLVDRNGLARWVVDLQASEGGKASDLL